MTDLYLDWQESCLVPLTGFLSCKHRGSTDGGWVLARPLNSKFGFADELRNCLGAVQALQIQSDDRLRPALGIDRIKSLARPGWNSSAINCTRIAVAIGLPVVSAQRFTGLWIDQVQLSAGVTNHAFIGLAGLRFIILHPALHAKPVFGQR